MDARHYTIDTTRAYLGEKRKSAEEISFTDVNLVDITTPHHDPLFITPMLKRKNNGGVRLQIDTGALVDILY